MASSDKGKGKQDLDKIVGQLRTIRDEIQRWKKVIVAANIKPEN